jgi:hypothetical protein
LLACDLRYCVGRGRSRQVADLLLAVAPGAIDGRAGGEDDALDSHLASGPKHGQSTVDIGPVGEQRIAQAAWNAGEEALALEEASAALKLRPDWELAALFRAQALQRRSNDEAIAFLGEYLGSHPQAKDARLKKRTLTNLYNERPTWLKLAHETLDRAVLAAYAATDSAGDWSEDWAEVWVDTGAGQPLPADHALAAKRAEVDQKVLANLVRLNQQRAAKK